MNISYDSYRVFYYAAKYKSFSQAAAALYNNQPNVTRIIRRLESELHCALFSRSPQGVRLTPEGKRHAEGVLAPLHRLEEQVFGIMGAERMKEMTDAITLFNLVFEKEMEAQANE